MKKLLLILIAILCIAAIANADTFNNDKLRFSEIKVYVDGELVGSLKQEGELNLTEDEPFKFANDFGGRQLVGWLDEIYIYDHVMTEDGIKSILEGKALSVSPDKSLIAMWGKLKSE